MRKGLLLLSALLALSLTGCAREPGEPGLWDRALLRLSGIASDGEYQKYEELRREGRLDGEGQFRLTSQGEEQEGRIRVTLARNSSLSLSWFRDEARTQPVEDGLCRLNPGDSLYPSEPVPAPLYQFTGFRLWVWAPDGSRSLYREIPAGEPVTVPADFGGTELSVEPVGQYQNRTLTLEAYCKDGGRKIPLPHEGEWYVNGRRSTGGTAELKPAESCDVVFTWNPENYYLGEASPRPVYVDEEEGKATFPRTEAGQAGEYAVELIPWAAVTVKLRPGDRLLVNGEEPEGRNGLTVKLTGLRVGDELVVISPRTERPSLESSRLLRYTHRPLQDSTEEHRFEVMATSRREG